MRQPIQPTTAQRKHLLTSEELAKHAGATAANLTDGHRHGNGLRIHRTYILVVSLATLVFLVLAIAVASNTR